jgi:hypothetical protein
MRNSCQEISGESPKQQQQASEAAANRCTRCTKFKVKMHRAHLCSDRCKHKTALTLTASPALYFQAL